MKIDRRRALAAGGALLSTMALPPRTPCARQTCPHREHASPHRAARFAGDHPQGDRQICVGNMNKRDGLLGRPVEWVLRDDQSRPDLTRTLYDRLVTVGQRRPDPEPLRDRIDPVRDRRGAALGKMLIHIRSASEARQVRHAVPDPVRPSTRRTLPNTMFDALEAAKPPKTVAIVTSKFPSVHAMSVGAREVAQEARPQGGAPPGVGVRQPRLRRHRQPRQGSESGPALERRHRHRPGTDARGDEQVDYPPPEQVHLSRRPARC